jgi:hypothetical protein
LLGRRAAPQGVAAEFAPGKIQLETDQAVAPVSIDWPAPPQGEDRPLLGGPPDVNQLPRGAVARVEGPVVGPRRASGSRANAGAAALREGGHIARAVGPEGAQRLEADSPPDLALKEAVEVLDRVLQPQFAGGHEDRRDAQVEAQPADPANGIPVLVGTLKPGVIVKLRKAGPPVVPPVRDEPRENRRRRRPPQRPCGGQAAVKRHAGEDVEERSPGQLEVFDHIEEIELGLPERHRGEMPAGGRRRAPLALTPIKGAPAGQNAADGADRGHWVPSTTLQLSMDGLGAILPEEAVGPQPATQSEHARFEGRRGAVGRRMPRAPAVTPVHPIETVRASAAQPVLHLREAEAPATSDGALTLPSANGLDQAAPLRFVRGLFLIAPCRLGVFSPS